MGEREKKKTEGKREREVLKENRKEGRKENTIILVEGRKRGRKEDVNERGIKNRDRKKH